MKKKLPISPVLREICCISFDTFNADVQIYVINFRVYEFLLFVNR
jgi:hypothetical protein